MPGVKTHRRKQPGELSLGCFCVTVYVTLFLCHTEKQKNTINYSVGFFIIFFIMPFIGALRV